MPVPYPNMHGHTHVCALANTCGPTYTHAKRKPIGKGDSDKATLSS